MLDKAGFRKNMRDGLWAEAVSAAALLDSVAVKPGGNKGPCEKFFQELPKWT